MGRFKSLFTGSATILVLRGEFGFLAIEGLSSRIHIEAYHEHIN